MKGVSRFAQKLWGRKTETGDWRLETGSQGAAARTEGVVDERTIALGQIWAQVNAAIGERDPEDWNLWHWVQDLYFDQGQLFAITISAGRLYRWPVAVDGDAVTVGEPVAVVVSFVDSGEMGRSLARRVKWGVWEIGSLGDGEIGSLGDGEQLPTAPSPYLPIEEAPTVYELEPKALEQLADAVVGHRSLAGRFEQLAFDFEQKVTAALARVDALTTELEQRATAVDGRLAKLEQEDQVRYRQYDLEKPKQPVVKFGVRPRERKAQETPDVSQESEFARKARERRVKG